DAAALFDWGRRLIEQTADLVCCYKPNIAFYEQFGLDGLAALQQTIAAVPDDIPVLLDAKRGDIGSTAAAYARAAFEVWGADAVTVNPYLGRDGVAPFLAYPGKTAFVLCYTSNPSAAEIQEFGGEERLFERIIRQAQNWGNANQIGFVVGATQPQALARVREVMAGQPHWILAPGVGTQGGDLLAALAAGLDPEGSGLIVPVSRSVIYAEQPRQATLKLREQIKVARQEARGGGLGFRPAATVYVPPGPAAFAPDHLDLILQLHEVGCVQFGQFTLASGRQSPVYLDLRRITASPALVRLATQAYAALLHPLKFDHIAAVPYAALTLGTAVALALDKPLIYPRKEVKAYGTGRSIEGVFQAGDKVVVIEDLVTSGGSVIKSIEQLAAAGLQVRDVAVLIDREQGGAETLAAKGYRLHAALKMTDILATLQESGRISAAERVQVEQYLRGQ
ncbi:MAG TPA: orotidine-5'-phosphate decarboxylase, partial [Anaerolineae bacterium]|nr:orotidine-5'-phosphate decarboxylase [Anaerolineae bacterium]